MNDQNKPFPSRNEILRKAAGEFAAKTSVLSSVLEIALVGSVVRRKESLKDVDIAVMVQDLSEIPIIAKFGRQISKYYPSWDLFLFSTDFRYLGRMCHRKVCPGLSVDCNVPGCGQPEHVQVIQGFMFDPAMLLKTEIEVLWKKATRSKFLSWQESFN